MARLSDYWLEQYHAKSNTMCKSKEENCARKEKGKNGNQIDRKILQVVNEHMNNSI